MSLQSVGSICLLYGLRTHVSDRISASMSDELTIQAAMPFRSLSNFSVGRLSGVNRYPQNCASSEFLSGASAIATVHRRSIMQVPEVIQAYKR